MRSIAVLLTLSAMPLSAQSAEPLFHRLKMAQASTERSISQANEPFGAIKALIERDLEILDHLMKAEAALRNNMQPMSSVEKAHDEVKQASGKMVPPIDPVVTEGMVRVRRELESARLSPATADFGRLQSILRDDAINPMRRMIVRNSSRVQEAVVEWLKLQDAMNRQIRAFSEVTADGLRKAAY